MTATHDPHRAASEYMRRIRNQAKKEYAYRWYDYCTGFTDRCPADPRDLGCMAAQAVRLCLATIGISPANRKEADA